MSEKPIVSIVTPCYNAEKYIRMTIASVLNQTAFLNNRATLDYTIVDGGSTDETLRIINDMINTSPLKDCVKVISEPDKGMYDALVKGMKLARGEIFSYLNADDYYNITAVDVVLTIMENYPIKWLTGYDTHYNGEGHITLVHCPHRFRRKFIIQGIYGTKLQYIQQESTFWRRELNNLIDFETLRSLKYAGDYYLWLEFSKKNSLFIVETYLGGFRHRTGQLSQSKGYHAERQTFCPLRATIFDKFVILKDKIYWRMSKLSRIFNCVKNEDKEYIHFIYDVKKNKWMPLTM